MVVLFLIYFHLLEKDFSDLFWKRLSLFSKTYPNVVASIDAVTMDLAPPREEIRPAAHPASAGVYAVLGLHDSIAVSARAYVPPRRNKSVALIRMEDLPVENFSKAPMDAPASAPETDAQIILERASCALFLFSCVHIIISIETKI